MQSRMSEQAFHRGSLLKGVHGYLVHGGECFTITMAVSVSLNFRPIIEPPGNLRRAVVPLSSTLHNKLPIMLCYADPGTSYNCELHFLHCWFGAVLSTRVPASILKADVRDADAEL